MQASCSVPLVPLVLMASALLPLGSSRRLDNVPCHAPSLYILCTIPPHTLLGELSCLISKYAFPDTNFSVARGFVGLPGQDHVSWSRVVSLQSPKLRPGWISFVVTTSSLNAMLVTLQTMRGVAHLSRSCWLCESYSSVSNPDLMGSHLEASRSP